jgi:hypothetical protein
VTSVRAALCAALIGVPSLAVLIGAERTPPTMATAANQFLASLTQAQRQEAVFPFDGDERTRWHFIPTEMFARKGLTLKTMSEPQRRLAKALLQSGLSQRGYLTVTSIMDLESVLAVMEAGGQFVRDPERYFFSIFGTPSERGAWGWRVEGHHVSLHFSVVNGRFVASSPQFFGTNPAEVRSGPKTGTRLLGAHEDPARALVTSLDPAQRAKAIINTTAPGDIMTMNALDISPLNPAGIGWNDLTAAQRETLQQIIASYTSVAADEVAAERQSRFRAAGLDKISFVWAGPIERGQRHYYRVQGPTFLIEYDNTQNDGNHVHSVWRDFAGDFGRDLLREHLAAFHH